MALLNQEKRDDNSKEKKKAKEREETQSPVNITTKEKNIKTIGRDKT